jgi:hypothetical protein
MTPKAEPLVEWFVYSCFHQPFNGLAGLLLYRWNVLFQSWNTRDKKKPTGPLQTCTEPQLFPTTIEAT